MLPTAVFKVTFLAVFSFAIAWALTPLLLRTLVRLGMGKQIRDGATCSGVCKLHQAKAGTPTMGGIIVWGTVLVVALLFSYLALAIPIPFSKSQFFSRSQVLLPLGALIASAIVGAIDDIYNAKRIGPAGGGLDMRHRFLLYTAIASVGAWWFAVKLGWDILHVPFVGDFAIGWWYVPFLFSSSSQRLFP